MRESIIKATSILLPKEKRMIVLLSIGSIILSLTEALSIGIIIPLMQIMLNPKEITRIPLLNKAFLLFGIHNVANPLIPLIIFSSILFIGKFIYSLYMLKQQQTVMADIYNRLTSSTFASYMTKPYQFFFTNNTAHLFKNISSEVSNFVYYLLSPLTIILSEVLVLCGIYIVLFRLYPGLMTLLCAVFLMVMLVTNLILNKRIQKYGRQREAYSNSMYKTALESFAAVKEIQAYGVYNYFVHKLRDSAEQYSRAFTSFAVISGAPRYIFETVLFAVVLLLFWIWSVTQVPAAKIIPMVTVLGIASLRLLPSFSKIYLNMNLLHYGKNSIDIVYSIMHEVALMPSPLQISKEISDDRLTVQKGDHTISLANVVFQYEASTEPILSDFSLTIPLHQIVAIIGSTGSGKSTVIDIIMGLLTPVSGTLSIKGKLIQHNAGHVYSKAIGYVPQHINLMDDTLRANVAFGIPFEIIDNASIWRALDLAQLTEFVQGLPNGIDTVIGEKGVRISGGERQRIGIARALYRVPEILILDEATSALDTLTERAFYNSLACLKKNMSILLVTHRLATLECCDYIIVMEKGRVINKGTYESLSPYWAELKLLIESQGKVLS